MSTAVGMAFGVLVAWPLGVAMASVTPVSSLLEDLEPVVAFAEHAPLTAWARERVNPEGSERERADQLYEALEELLQGHRILSDPDNRPKERLPQTAGELFARAMSDGTPPTAGCYEWTALYVAAARALHLNARGAERAATVGAGQIGHIVAVVQTTEGEHLSYDLQNRARGQGRGLRLLGDEELAAHHYNHLAVAHSLREEWSLALRAIDVALAWAPDNPSFLNNRATILLGLGELHLSVAEASGAVVLAPRVALYRYQLGRLLLTAGELQGARRALREALALEREYRVAQRDLGWVSLLLGDTQEAQDWLERAAAPEPAPQSQLYLSLYWLSRDEPGRALTALGARASWDAPMAAAAHIASAAKRGEALEASHPEVRRLLELLRNLPSAQRLDGISTHSR